MARLSEAELVARSGVAVERVRRFVELGILRPSPEGFRPPDIQLARMFDAFDGAGMAAEQIGELIGRGEWSNAWADLIFPSPFPYSERTLEELVSELVLTRSL